MVWPRAQPMRRIIVLIVERAAGGPIRDVCISTTCATTGYSAYGDGTSPDGHVRAIIEEDGTEAAVPAHDPRAHNNAFTVGGGTRVFGAQAWRFHPNDLRMATTYGIPEGSALADWPITYDDLEPYYDKIEVESASPAMQPQPQSAKARVPDGPMAAVS